MPSVWRCGSASARRPATTAAPTVPSSTRWRGSFPTTPPCCSRRTPSSAATVRRSAAGRRRAATLARSATAAGITPPRCNIDTMERVPPDPLGSMRSLLQAMAESPLPSVGVQPGAVLDGRCRIDERLGMGGMGVVYRAHDTQLGRDVAIKLTAYAEGDAQLRREAVALARLAHPNVVAAYEVAELNAGVFIVMELVRGKTLRAWLRARRRSWRDVVGVFRQAGEGLAAIHRAGLVHRD